MDLKAVVMSAFLSFDYKFNNYGCNMLNLLTNKNLDIQSLFPFGSVIMMMQYKNGIQLI